MIVHATVLAFVVWDTSPISPLLKAAMSSSCWNQSLREALLQSDYMSIHEQSLMFHPSFFAYFRKVNYRRLGFEKWDVPLPKQLFSVPFIVRSDQNISTDLICTTYIPYFHKLNGYNVVMSNRLSDVQIRSNGCAAVCRVNTIIIKPLILQV